jgi:hypothetical protein
LKLPDKNVEAVRDRFRDRAETGFKKYGTTTERTDLTYADWLQHAQDEAMDAAVYLERLKSYPDAARMDEAIREALGVLRGIEDTAPSEVRVAMKILEQGLKLEG